jgi:hypothetical protein
MPAIEQRHLNVTEPQNLDALTRVLEVEASEAALVFVSSARPRETVEHVLARRRHVKIRHRPAACRTLTDRQATIAAVLLLSSCAPTSVIPPARSIDALTRE